MDRGACHFPTRYLCKYKYISYFSQYIFGTFCDYFSYWIFQHTSQDASHFDIWHRKCNQQGNWRGAYHPLFRLSISRTWSSCQTLAHCKKTSSAFKLKRDWPLRLGCWRCIQRYPIHFRRMATAQAQRPYCRDEPNWEHPNHWDAQWQDPHIKLCHSQTLGKTNGRIWWKDRRREVLGWCDHWYCYRLLVTSSSKAIVYWYWNLQGGHYSSRHSSPITRKPTTQNINKEIEHISSRPSKPT